MKTTQIAGYLWCCPCGSETFSKTPIRGCPACGRRDAVARALAPPAAVTGFRARNEAELVRRANLRFGLDAKLMRRALGLARPCVPAGR